MDFGKEQRTINTALGNYRDLTLRALRETRTHVGQALDAIEASDWRKVSEASRDAVRSAADAAASAGLLYGSAVAADAFSRWQDGKGARI